MAMPNSPDDELPQRQNPSPGIHINLGQSNFVLLTVTTEKRDPWLANETAHRLLHQTWSEAKAWLVGDYLLMPDHLKFPRKRGQGGEEMRKESGYVHGYKNGY